LGFGGGCMHEPFMVLFSLIPLPNPWAKGLDFGVFGVLGLEEFLAGFLRFLLIQRVLVDHNLAMECPWGVPTIPKVLFGSVEWIGKLAVRFGGVDPQVLFIASCLGYADLTGALDQSDWCEPFVEFALGELLNPCVFGSGCCWSVIGLFGVVLLGFVLGFPSVQVVFWGVFVSGPREVTEALCNICCVVSAATGLTGSSHQSNRCHRSDRHISTRSSVKCNTKKCCKRPTDGSNSTFATIIFG
jgi:hypothetical protein